MVSTCVEQALSLITPSRAGLSSTTERLLPLPPKFKEQYQTETFLRFHFLCSRLPVSLLFPGSVLSATQLTGFPSTDCNPIPNLPPGDHTQVTRIETVDVPKLFSHTVTGHFLVCAHKYLIHDWLNPQKVTISNSWIGMKTLQNNPLLDYS